MKWSWCACDASVPLVRPLPAATELPLAPTPTTPLRLPEALKQWDVVSDELGNEIVHITTLR